MLQPDTETLKYKMHYKQCFICLWIFSSLLVHVLHPWHFFELQHALSVQFFVVMHFPKGFFIGLQKWHKKP